MSKIKTYPVDINGNMLDYDGYGVNTRFGEKDIVEFEETMTFLYYTKGRSSLRFILEDSKGGIWSMMAQCIDTFVQKSANGKLTGKWIMCKRGANYGLLIVEGEK
ncbi:MAG: hypothetical protein RR959_08355 [Erysipelotrichaceae bacterium]